MTKGFLTATLALLTTTAAFGESYVVRDLSGALTNSNLEGQNIRPIFPSLGLYKIESTKPSIDGAIQALTNSSQARALGIEPSNVEVFLNHMMTLRDVTQGSQARNTPNDDDFGDQWSLQSSSETFGINAADAWQITTGGTNVQGQEVVIAVVDNGFDTDHEDLESNLWINSAEIPGNGIDDDNNGFVDDINGINVRDGSGNIEEQRHGTHVAGIMSATGDNNLGVTGVNWNTKVMLVSMGRSLAQTTQTLEAYNYILDQKKKWLASNGEEGANVVAINSSFGIDLADCTSGDFNLWNDVYNELGEYGILSAAATANRNINVDVRGDVPTTCSSDYIVGVTNSTIRGVKANSAAFGAENIDLAAPGTDVFATLPNDSYGELTGTSMATPHVTGAIGILYSAASQELSELAFSDPSAAALIMKDILLESVNPISTLSDQTVSGGILDLGAATLLASQYSTGTTTPGDDVDDVVVDEPATDPLGDDEDDTQTEVFSSNVIQNIPDAFFSPGSVSSTITNVSEVTNVRALEIRVKIDHPYHSDLSLNLTAPNGRSVLLRFKERGAGEETFIYTLESNNTYESLSSLGDSVEAGNWTLQVTDHHFSDRGVLMGWFIKN